MRIGNRTGDPGQELHYARPGDELEVPLEGFVIDIRRGNVRLEVALVSVNKVQLYDAKARRGRSGRTKAGYRYRLGA